MKLKNEIITYEDNNDYFVYDFIEVNKNTYYLLFKVIDNKVTEEILFLKENNERLEPISSFEEQEDVKYYFLQDNLNKIHGVPTPHIESNYNDIAPIVIMPGDPLRAKYIAENYFENARLVSDVRNVYAYTGYYNGKRVTAMAAGMGMPSAGIYYHELFSFYDVETIIRIGTCGGTEKEEKLFDLVIADKAFTTSNFAETYTGTDSKIAYPSKMLTDKLVQSCEKNNVGCHMGGVFTMDFFGPYINEEHLYKKIPKDFDVKAEEMECFGLFLIANTLGKEAACILSVVDSPFYNDVVSSTDREAGLKNMLEVALDAVTNKI